MQLVLNLCQYVDDRLFLFIFLKGHFVAINSETHFGAYDTILQLIFFSPFFLQTVQSQQQAEWDAAIARVEQSRTLLAMRLAEHQGRKYKVIEEAMAFVSDINTDTHNFVSHEDQCTKDLKDQSDKEQRLGLGMLMQALSSSAALAKGSVGGILGNAAVFAVSMLALLQLNQMACRMGGKGHFGKRREMVDRSMRLSISRG